MLGFDGTTLNSDLRHLIRDLRASGIILFKANVNSPDQLKQLCQDAQNFALDCGRPKLFIAVDQEGGVVSRLKEPLFREFPGNPGIRTPEEADAFAMACAEQLRQMGINMNMAPVLDVAPPGIDSIMKTRVFPGDENLVATLGTRVIEGLQSRGIMAVAKHFPGIGRTVKDSHFSLPVLDADLDTLRSSDIKPFEAGFRAGVAGVMLSHISYPLLDDRWQASLSVRIARDLLRKELGYKGLVMTDDFDMKAISHDIKTCMHRVLQAQIDLALICHKGPNIDKAFEAVLASLDSDPDLYDAGRASMKRIMVAKETFLG